MESESHLPAFVLAERDDLISSIFRAYANVSLEGGTSWKEAQEIDNRGTPEERAQARATDAHLRWQDLVYDPGWVPDYGPWWFLDDIGFVYYLPAAMVRCITEGETVEFFPYKLERDPKWWLTTHEQRRCLRRFVEYMVVTESYLGRECGLWREALGYPSVNFPQGSKATP